ncbi:MAG: HEAT repeat domain-containing protein, partial [Candidatus Heimdallarchaeota archaeon]
MRADELKQQLRKGEFNKISLQNMKIYQTLIEFLIDEDDIVRKNTVKLLFRADYIPTEEILKRYIKEPNSLIKDVLIKQLPSFIPILSKYLVRDNSFEILFDIFSEIQSKTIFTAIKKAYSVTPILSTFTELSLRTCHVSFSNLQDTFINFHFISDQSKEIKKILLYRLKQANPLYTELTLFTVTQYPELAHLVIKQIREIVLKSKEEEAIKYASLALMHIDEPKNSDVLIQRLSNFSDSTDTQLAIIESLGNLGNPKAANILVEQFKKGDPAAYYAARSLAMIGNTVLPLLITALEEDKNVPYIIESMKRIGDASYDFLMSALQKGKKKVRKNAAQCLTLVMSQKYGYEGAIRLLTTQLAGKNPSILEAVTQALLTLGTPSIRVLIEELQDDDLQLRKNAKEVLQYFGFENIELALDGHFETNLNQAVKLGLILYLYYPSKEMQDL